MVSVTNHHIGIEIGGKQQPQEIGNVKIGRQTMIPVTRGNIDRHQNEEQHKNHECQQRQTKEKETESPQQIKEKL